MFLRTFTLAAIATMATIVAACKSITFTIFVNDDFTYSSSTLEVNSFYSGYSIPQRFGLWAQSVDFTSYHKFYSYKLDSYNSASDEFLLRLVISSSGEEYRFTGASKRPDYWTWEYWSCVDVGPANSSQSNRPRNSTVSGPQRQKPPNASNTPQPRNPTFLVG